jgi:hypothetical protein
MLFRWHARKNCPIAQSQRKSGKLAEHLAKSSLLVQPKSRNTLGSAVVKCMQVKRRVTRTLFFGYRFNGIDSKIVHILTHVPYDCGSSNKNGFRAAEIS